MPRTNASQLPSDKELKAIISQEARRPLAPGKEHRHFVDFQAILAILDHYRLPSDFFVEQYSAEEVTTPAFLEKLNVLLASLLQRISEDKRPPLELFAAYYDYLSVADDPRPSDLIFIFGSATLFRTEKAARLFNQGYAPRVMISGKGPIYQENQLSEAETLSRYIQTLGVPWEALILEMESITIVDNVRRSLNLLDQLGQAFSSILLVNSPYSQRRGWACFQKYLPENVVISTATAETRPEYSRNQWHENDIGRKIVLNEAFKLKVSVSLDTA